MKNGETVSHHPASVADLQSATRALRCGEMRGARPVATEARRSSRQEAAAASLTYGEDVGLDVATAPLCD